MHLLPAALRQAEEELVLMAFWWSGFWNQRMSPYAKCRLGPVISRWEGLPPVWMCLLLEQPWSHGGSRCHSLLSCS